MAVDNKTEDTALMTHGAEMPDGSFRPNIVNMEHTLSIAQSGNQSTMTAAQLTHADLKVAAAEARARVEIGRHSGTAVTGGSIKKGK
jgi:hypothetical protein